MSVFIERFVLAILAAFFILLAVTNPMGFSWLHRGICLVTTVLLALLAAIFSVRHNRRMQRRALELPDVVRADIKVSDVIDFIVNDSRAELAKPPPPEINGYGPGTTLYVGGVEHQDARRMLNEKLMSGELRSWGLRQIDTHIPNQFESSAREIPKAYWDDMQLDFQSCLYYKGPYSQTMKIPGRQERERWADISLSKRQAEQFWPPKSKWSRCYAKVMRRKRIGHATRIDV